MEIRSDRPHVICHMMMSLNAKITGPYMDSPWAAPGHDLYNVTHDRLGVQAWANGRTTTEEAFTRGRAPRLGRSAPAYPREDWVVDPEATHFYVSVDASGRVGWEEATLHYAGRPAAHIVEVLSEQVSDPYIALLRDLGISYVFAGDDRLDFGLALRKLRSLFGIERLALDGGAQLNGSFLNEGLVDELSLLVAPALDDSTTSSTIFERPAHLESRPPTGFRLREVEVLEGDCLWLRYERA